LAAADIYVSSSIWEGLPMSILEAMIAGLPVIATGVGDIPRVVTSDAGLIVPPAQPEALAEAMARLLDDPALCQSMGAAARRHSLAEFSADVWMDRILALYREVIEPRGQKLAPV
jgi:glycosyltransferase involved in cell wall biosynthesis